MNLLSVNYLLTVETTHLTEDLEVPFHLKTNVLIDEDPGQWMAAQIIHVREACRLSDTGIQDICLISAVPLSSVPNVPGRFPLAVYPSTELFQAHYAR